MRRLAFSAIAAATLSAGSMIANAHAMPVAPANSLNDAATLPATKAQFVFGFGFPGFYPYPFYGPYYGPVYRRYYYPRRHYAPRRYYGPGWRYRY